MVPVKLAHLSIRRASEDRRKAFRLDFLGRERSAVAVRQISLFFVVACETQIIIIYLGIPAEWRVWRGPKTMR